MRLQDLVSRLSISDIQFLLGANALRLLNMLNTRQPSSSALLQKFVLDTIGEQSILTNERYRDFILPVLHRGDLKRLLTFLGEPTTDDVYQQLALVSFRNEEKLSKLLAFFDIDFEDDYEPKHQVSQATVLPQYSLF